MNNDSQENRDQQQEQFGNPQAQANQQGGILRGARDMAENQIDQAIDQYANRIPGGTGLTKEAKDAVGGILDGLERDGENRLGQMGGGLFGGNSGNSNERNNRGGDGNNNNNNGNDQGLL